MMPFRRLLRPLKRRWTARRAYRGPGPTTQNDLIDVYLTTYRRPEFLERAMDSLMAACAESPFRHRVTVMVDAADRQTLDVLDQYLEQISLVTSPAQLGLPFMDNLMLDHSDSLIARSEERPRALCYLQDDCLITSPRDYFPTMAAVHEAVLPERQRGYVSGFYTPLHPGFEVIEIDGVTVVKSDSVDGKNIMGTPDLFRSVGRLPWYFAGGARRGNPGPRYGSQFDIWQWQESPHSTKSQRRVNLIIPGLVESMAQSASESTWDNPGDQPDEIEARIRQGRIYGTRGDYPTLDPSDYFKPD